MKPVAVFRHAPTEGPGYFATFLDEHRIAWRLVKLDEGEGVPARAADFAGLAFMGGPMSVNDPLPWIPPVLELIRDVAFAAPPLSLAKAHDLIARTKAGQLMKGYRGSPALDADAYARALVALGRMAHDLGDALESVDVNPFLLQEQGGMALDALVVLRPPREG